MRRGVCFFLIQLPFGQTQRHHGGAFADGFDLDLRVFVARVVEGVHQVEDVVGEAFVATVVAACLDGANHVGHADAARAIGVRVRERDALFFFSGEAQNDIAAKAVGVGNIERALRAVDFEGGQAVRVNVEAHVDGGESALRELECADDVRRDFHVNDLSVQGFAGNGAGGVRGARVAGHALDGANELD